MTDQQTTLVSTVIAGGYCIGCGVCAAGRNAPFRIADDGLGRLAAVPVGDGVADLEICPFSGAGPDESELAAELFSAPCRLDHHVGYWHFAGALALAEAGDREQGSSGGGVTWLLRKLMQQGEIDGVAHVKPVSPATDPDGRLFRFRISTSPEALEQGRKSAYYPVELSEMIDHIRRVPGRYAVVAIPCFAKALRLLARKDAVIAERLAVIGGIVCGHLKSKYYAEYLAWTAGVRPTELTAIDFRKKNPRGRSADYGIVASSGSVTVNSLPIDNYFATPWELGIMKYKACDYCDDVFAETADVVFGDAWIPPYEQDWLGHNIVVSRRPQITALLRAGKAKGEIALDEIALDQVVASQAGGLRHRREGLAYRLALADGSRQWRPAKRVGPRHDGIAPDRAAIYRQRMMLSELSVKSFAAAKRFRYLLAFYAQMTWPVFRYYQKRSGTKTALMQTFACKWLKRILVRWRLR